MYNNIPVTPIENLDYNPPIQAPIYYQPRYQAPQMNEVQPPPSTTPAQPQSQDKYLDELRQIKYILIGIVFLMFFLLLRRSSYTFHPSR